MTTEEKRAELRQRIAAGEQRNEERKEFSQYAREARDNAVGFAKEHPFATVAGGVVLGLLIGALTPKGRKLGRRAGSLATALAEAGLVYATDAAITGRDRLDDLGDGVASTARSARRDIGYKAANASDTLRSLGRTVSKKSSRAVRDARRSLTN
ncbi:hypothetical protein [Qipengyuania oceanensis]|uniref:DUF883 family protein n=1 Tax=Qipengyuania oceanensis TaxID=1463597 RepID=A0A844YBN4_9SPHN|nr:hypothetical protein [Qipengyuania oceanensis]MXO61621.1 hypothetical protein [Qipengyuania oceanensis]